MEEKKPSVFNDEFDLGIALKIIRKNIIWVILLVVIGFTFAFLKVRYTQPVFDANAIVKIGDKNDVNQLMQLENIYETNINSELTRLNSKSLFEKAIQKLPLGVSYFTQGKFLNTENYKTSPYTVLYQINNTQLLDQELWVDFINQFSAVLTYGNQDSSSYFLAPVNRWFSWKGLEMKIVINPYQLDQIKGSEIKHFFIIHSKEKMVNNLFSSMEVSIVDASAKTLGIKFSGNSPKKCADLASAMAEEFLSFNVEKKKEGANKMIDFTDEQIEKINRNLNYFERLLRPYKKLELQQDKGFDVKDLKVELVKGDKDELKDVQQHIADLNVLIDVLKKEKAYDELYSTLVYLSTKNRFNNYGENLKNRLNQIRYSKFQLEGDNFMYKELQHIIDLEKRDFK
jgi:tyrosine-protein kinase Etk/Wzc